MLAGTTPIETSKILGITRQGVFFHVKDMLAKGELTPDQCNYQKAGPIEERKWYKIVERAIEELPFYAKQGIVPTARKMGYRLVELKVMIKKDLDRWYRVSAEARRGVDYTYRKASKYPKMPIDCFKDDLRTTIGEGAMCGPTEPTPDQPPDDPIELVLDAIQDLKDTILDYDGSCIEGDPGENPGRWYKQPIYTEIFCESETIQPDLYKFQGNRRVMVSAMRGQFSTPSMYRFCKRLAETAEKYDWIEKIVILYFGDSDKAGNDIRNKVKDALEWYCGSSPDLTIPVEVELRHVMITPEQIRKFKLTGSQLEAFMTTEKRLKDFTKIVQKSIDDCWDEDTYRQNCPDEEYDYEGNGVERPEDIDIDNELFGETDLTLRERMIQMPTYAFRKGWESS